VILDSVEAAEARRQLTVCCGAHRWVEGMMSERPFGTADRATRAADRIWGTLGPADWLEAFDHHPRIGEAKAAMAQDAKAATLSSSEQARVTTAGVDVRQQLAEVNAEYERRFGFIYIVCAAGKSADQLLAMARKRLGNERDQELRVAAEEQRKIMQLRLAKLLEAT
jgi:2-oxo-4-hydroxy-4-carboxy-5-ureidoimidazoline decarboxylase